MEPERPFQLALTSWFVGLDRRAPGIEGTMAQEANGAASIAQLMYTDTDGKLNVLCLVPTMRDGKLAIAARYFPYDTTAPDRNDIMRFQSEELNRGEAELKRFRAGMN